HDRRASCEPSAGGGRLRSGHGPGGPAIRRSNMTRPMICPAVAAAAALAASCAPSGDMGMPGSAAADPGRQCFYGDQVRNFRAGGPNQLYIRAPRDEVFELNASGGCTDLDFTHRLAITPDGGGVAG